MPWPKLPCHALRAFVSSWPCRSSHGRYFHGGFWLRRDRATLARRQGVHLGLRSPCLLRVYFTLACDHLPLAVIISPAAPGKSCMRLAALACVQARQNSLYPLHTCEGIPGATPVCDGLWLGGWEAARPRVADSTLAEGRFKFFLGVTEWKPGQLQQEVDDGCWLMLDCAPELVIKDRVIGWRPGKLKPLWTELAQLIGEQFTQYLRQVYPQSK
eukprot:723694-Pleurochrysis_carterae.AAC.3